MILLPVNAPTEYSIMKFSTQSHYIGPQHNLWFKVDINRNAQYFNVYNTLGYSLNGDTVMWT